MLISTHDYFQTLKIVSVFVTFLLILQYSSLTAARHVRNRNKTNREISVRQEIEEQFKKLSRETSTIEFLLRNERATPLTILDGSEKPVPLVTSSKTTDVTPSNSAKFTLSKSFVVKPNNSGIAPANSGVQAIVVGVFEAKVENGTQTTNVNSSSLDQEFSSAMNTLLQFNSNNKLTSTTRERNLMTISSENYDPIVGTTANIEASSEAENVSKTGNVSTLSFHYANPKFHIYAGNKSSEIFEPNVIPILIFSTNTSMRNDQIKPTLFQSTTVKAIDEISISLSSTTSKGTPSKDLIISENNLISKFASAKGKSLVESISPEQISFIRAVRDGLIKKVSELDGFLEYVDVTSKKKQISVR